MLRALGLMLALAGGVQAQTSPFEPSVCAVENGGKIAVRLHPSGRAFLLPPEGFHLRSAFVDQVAGEPPLGCPDNPLRTGSISFPLQYQAMLAARRGENVAWPELVSVALFGHAGPLNVRGGNYRSLLSRAESSTCEPITDALSVCYSCERHPDAPEFCLGTRTDSRGISARRPDYISKIY